MSPLLVIALSLVVFAAVIFLDFNVASIGSRLVPNYQHFLSGVSPPLRLIWHLIVLLLAFLFVPTLASPSTVSAFLASPAGEIFGTLITLGIFIVLVAGFIKSRRRQRKISATIAVENRAPCTSWPTCRRDYAIVEYDNSKQPWQELSRRSVLTIEQGRAIWSSEPDA